MATPGPGGSDWKAKCAGKRAEAQNKIPKEWTIKTEWVSSRLMAPYEENTNNMIGAQIAEACEFLSQRELSITGEYTVKQLLEALATGTLTAYEVAVAFCKRAAMAQQLTSCLTETYFEEAIQRAEQLDAMRKNGTLAGPLHGLPVSVKDTFKIKGSDATMGCASLIGKPAESNSSLIDLLLEQGAVVHCKTNVAQVLRTVDSNNNVWGRTLNPHNTALGAGGSSGGEGALLALRGSAVGVGTDIGGSIRLPAMCNGTYGFKPSASRIPAGGQSTPQGPGVDFLLASAGPLANDMETLTLFMKHVLDARPALFDVTALDIPWRPLPPAAKKPLRLGVVMSLTDFPLHPPVMRAMNTAIELLQAAGHEIVSIPEDEAHVLRLSQLASEYLYLDPTGNNLVEASGEPWVPLVAKVAAAAQKLDSSWLDDVRRLQGLQRLTALNVKRDELKNAWRMVWRAYELDAVITPPCHHTAVPHETFLEFPYTFFLNTLDYPACVIPFGKASAKLDPEPVSVEEGGHLLPYVPGLFDGAPTGVQISTPNMRDEECLQIATVVDEILNGGGHA